MTPEEKEIAAILDRYGEPIGASTWKVQGKPVIYHSALERIAIKARIRFDAPTILRCERDEAVILVTGHLPVTDEAERVEWSIGEALIGVNYRVSGKQAAYVFAMAEKRAKDRVILKLIELHGLLYSEEEADAFAEPNRDPPPPPPPQSAEAKALEKEIQKHKTHEAITTFMLSDATQKILGALRENDRNGVRQYAKLRMQALGWSAPAKQQQVVEHDAQTGEILPPDLPPWPGPVTVNGHPVEVSADPLPDDPAKREPLFEEAAEVAQDGLATYEAWFRSRSKNDRHRLIDSGQHVDNKAAAIRADDEMERLALLEEADRVDA